MRKKMQRFQGEELEFMVDYVKSIFPNKLNGKDVSKLTDLCNEKFWDGDNQRTDTVVYKKAKTIHNKLSDGLDPTGSTRNYRTSNHKQHQETLLRMNNEDTDTISESITKLKKISKIIMSGMNTFNSEFEKLKVLIDEDKHMRQSFTRVRDEIDKYRALINNSFR